MSPIGPRGTSLGTTQPVKLVIGWFLKWAANRQVDRGIVGSWLLWAPPYPSVNDRVALCVGMGRLETHPINLIQRIKQSRGNIGVGWTTRRHFRLYRYRCEIFALHAREPEA